MYLNNKLLSFFFIFFITNGIANAQWSSNIAEPRYLGLGIQAQLATSNDGSVYVAWLTDGDYQVRLQKFNRDGNALFQDSGFVVSDNPNSSWIAVYHLNIVIDGEDNVIISTVDQRSGNWEVYLYKIDGEGNMVWGDDGIAISNSGTDNISPRLTVLNDNNIAVSWSQNYESVRMQVINPEGETLLPEDIFIQSNSATLASPIPLTSPDGNLLLQWISQTGPVWASNSEIYIQKYNIEGNTVWDQPSLIAGPVIFPMGNWQQKIIVNNSGDIFSAWTQISGNVQSALVQQINYNGETVWDNPISFSLNTSHFRISPAIKYIENSSLLMSAWKETNSSQSERGVVSQCIDSTGNSLWGDNGIQVVPLNNSFDYLDISLNILNENIFISYLEQDPTMNANIFVSKIDENGNQAWENSVPITNTNDSKSDMTTMAGPGCVFIVWTENDSVFAHCLREDGTLGPPVDVDLNNLEYDINNDGDLDILDIISLSTNIIVASDFNNSFDYNYDLSMDIFDILLLSDYIQTH